MTAPRHGRSPIVGIVGAVTLPARLDFLYGQMSSGHYSLGFHIAALSGPQEKLPNPFRAKLPATGLS